MTALLEKEPVIAKKPAGYVEYEARNAIRDLIKIYGPQGARFLIREMLDDEARRAVR